MRIGVASISGAHRDQPLRDLGPSPMRQLDRAVGTATTAFRVNRTSELDSGNFRWQWQVVSEFLSALIWLAEY